jgi:hypothetical protein
LRLVIGSIVIFSIIILFLFALFPSDISVTRMIQINKPKTEIRKKIVDLRKWTNWNRFLFETDSVNKITGYATGKIDSNYIHEVYVNIDLLRTKPDSVFTRWQHDGKSFKGNFILTDMNGRTVVEWTLYFHIKWYPWEKLASMFYDKQLGPVMEKSLINLRNELERGT